MNYTGLMDLETLLEIIWLRKILCLYWRHVDVFRQQKKTRDYCWRPASKRQAVKIKPFWCRSRRPREWKDRCVRLSSHRSAPSRLILCKPSTTVAHGHLSDRETTSTWDTEPTLRQRDGWRESGWGWFRETGTRSRINITSNMRSSKHLSTTCPSGVQSKPERNKY